MKIQETIERDLRNEPQSVVRVYEDAQLKTDFTEYVLTDVLAREFAKVLEPIVESARPAAAGTNSVGVWVSGFFGSGKSHFAKVGGHLIANTSITGDTARDLFTRLFRVGSSTHGRLAELFQEAANYQLRATLVPFDIATEFAPGDVNNVGRTFLRALYSRIGLSRIIPFAERELELQRAGLHDDFVKLFEEKTGKAWSEEKDMAASMGDLAACLAELLPNRSAQEYRDNLKFEYDALSSMSIKDVVTRLVRWLDSAQTNSAEPHLLVFIADEIGAWSRSNLDRIEQVRGLVEELGVLAQGRIWLVATSQERLSDVVANAPGTDPGAARELQQRLEARFRINVHLESSEVSTVIEERILEKRPSARPELTALWSRHEAQLAGIAAPPGIEIGGAYPEPNMDNFILDYPFLPYQIPAAADLFGAMRGPKVSSGARSMIKVVFDAVKEVAGDDLGRIVSWDQIFDSANSDNEFADEAYLGSQGLTYLMAADRDVEATPPIQPSRVLKVLWLTQQSGRIPRTSSNLARLLIRNLDTDVLQLEREVAETLEGLEAQDYVRQEPATGQWRFLTQDQVTVERIVQRIVEEDVKASDLRDAIFKLYSDRLLALFNGRITHGRSNTAFDYGVFYGDTALKNETAPVQLRLSLGGTPAAVAAKERSASDLSAPVVYWVVPRPEKLEERLRRALAIDRLPTDEKLRQVATDRTGKEVEALKAEGDDLRADAGRDVQRALEQGMLYFAGQSISLDAGIKRRGRGAQATARTEAEKALHDRIDAKYTRFAEGDLDFNPSNVERVVAAPPADRAALDLGLGFFDAEGHLLPDHPVLEAIVKHLTTTTKNSGKDLIAHFRIDPFGWPQDLIRYATAALLVEGRLSAKDASGRLVEDPRQPAARTLLGTAQFRNARFEVEENPPTPQERSDARALLIELGAPPTDDGEIALKEAILQLANRLLERAQVVVKAREAAFPLPAAYERIDSIREELQGEGSRAKLIRTLLAHEQELRDIDVALDRLASFVKDNGLAQYRRGRELLSAAMDAGLSEDAERGQTIRAALEQWDAVEDQQRVLDEWDGPLADHRANVIEAYRSVYHPLREELVRKVAEARAAITSMSEFEQLSATNRAEVRSRFLADGQPLAEVSATDVRDEDQLVRATRELSIPHIRARLGALDGEIGLAKTLVLQLYGRQLKEEEEGAPQLVVWDPRLAFSGAQFSTEDDVDMVFDAAKEEVKALVRAEKIVRIL